ncbi:MAG: antibiotic biosynthesis monooxygenase [Amaricoccus sp.]|uniref:antibiotic biosynthesis monooxygenase family protein n=1 Tax=Amaricoccus sp. TaxID=1872485 RepID=UPI003314E633
MFIAMNRFRIVPGAETDFEEMWRTRDSELDQVDGFEAFKLLRGPTTEEHTLYISHSIWQDRAAFEAWTRSAHFRKAHATAGGRAPMYIGHPQFEGFESVVES